MALVRSHETLYMERAHFTEQMSLDENLNFQEIFFTFWVNDIIKHISRHNLVRLYILKANRKKIKINSLILNVDQYKLLGIFSWHSLTFNLLIIKIRRLNIGIKLGTNFFYRHQPIRPNRKHLRVQSLLNFDIINCLSSW